MPVQTYILVWWLAGSRIREYCSRYVSLCTVCFLLVLMPPAFMCICVPVYLQCRTSNCIYINISARSESPIEKCAEYFIWSFVIWASVRSFQLGRKKYNHRLKHRTQVTLQFTSTVLSIMWFQIVPTSWASSIENTQAFEFQATQWVSKDNRFLSTTQKTSRKEDKWTL